MHIMNEWGTHEEEDEIWEGEGREGRWEGDKWESWRKVEKNKGILGREGEEKEDEIEESREGTVWVREDGGRGCCALWPFLHVRNDRNTVCLMLHSKERGGNGQNEGQGGRETAIGRPKEGGGGWYLRKREDESGREESREQAREGEWG